MNKIYTITCICLKDFREHRCFGWFPTLHEAQEAIESGGHLHEALYDTLILEESCYGIHGRSTVLDIYKYNCAGGQWILDTNNIDYYKITGTSNWNYIG